MLWGIMKEHVPPHLSWVLDQQKLIIDATSLLLSESVDVQA